MLTDGGSKQCSLFNVLYPFLYPYFFSLLCHGPWNLPYVIHGNYNFEDVSTGSIKSLVERQIINTIVIPFVEMVKVKIII